MDVRAAEGSRSGGVRKQRSEHVVLVAAGSFLHSLFMWNETSVYHGAEASHNGDYALGDLHLHIDTFLRR